MSPIPTRTRGDSAPELSITISDANEVADFGPLTASDVRIKVELSGFLIIDGEVDSIDATPDGKSAVVKREGQAGELDIGGRYWVHVYVVPWDQTFPDDGPLRLDVVRAVGDA